MGRSTRLDCLQPVQEPEWILAIRLAQIEVARCGRLVEPVVHSAWRLELCPEARGRQIESRDRPHISRLNRVITQECRNGGLGPPALIGARSESRSCNPRSDSASRCRDRLKPEGIEERS